MIKRGALIVVAFLAVVVLASSLTIVWEDEYAVKIRLGKIVGSITEPGLYFKVPFIEDFYRITSRNVEYDSDPTDFITSDKKNIIIDTYARFQVSDPMKFKVSAQGSVLRAQQLIDDTVYSILRVEAGLMKFADIIGEGRESLMKVVTEQADKDCQEEYGISVLSVRIKRVSMAPENAASVHKRMIAERGRVANQYRSEGQEQALAIRAETDKEREIILAEAYKQAQELIGQGEAEALKIYADAFNKDSEFYKFLRTIEAYQKSFSDETIIVLSPDDPFLSFYKNGIK